MSPEYLTCTECGASFVRRNRRGNPPQTCSDGCRRHRTRRLEGEKRRRYGLNTWNETLTKQCRQCDETFTTTLPIKVFCSRECLSAWHEPHRSDRNVVRPARYEAPRAKPNRVGDVVSKLCLECDSSFTVTIKPGRGRHQELCSDECKLRSRRRAELRKYKITLEQYEDLWREQNGSCAICHGELLRKGDRWASVDHCHRTGNVRGLLCIRCNLAIGQFNDDVDLMTRAIAYLQNPRPVGRPVSVLLAEAREIIARYENLPPEAV